MHEPGKLKILFLCTGNSCRSQMAEGWVRQLTVESSESSSKHAKQDVQYAKV